MGLNYSLLNFMLHTKLLSVGDRSGNKKLLEIGKLKNSMSKDEKQLLSKKYHFPVDILNSDTATIYRYFGFETPHSLDADSFEGSNLIMNLNKLPSLTPYSEYFDLIIDGGTSEHVYNPIIAMANYFNLLKTSGNLVQFLPMNNYIDHGLYQFSPTFFWSLESSEIKIENYHLNYRGRHKHHYLDGLNDSVKAHFDGLYDGAGIPNLFRFTGDSIVNLVNWKKMSNLNCETLIFESNQEIYKKKWEGVSPINVNTKVPSYIKKLLPIIYKTKFSIVKYFLSKILIKANFKEYN